MNFKNKHHFSRNIPRKIEKQIRRESGYSCVICGTCPYIYEHIEPEFKDAKIHDPSKMTLLCATCHSKVTNKVFSKQRVWEAKNNPWALKNGHTKYGFEFTGECFYIVLGNLEIVSAAFPLVINGVPILSVTYSEEEKSVVLNGIFYHGETVVGRIIDNEWQGVVSDIDIQTVANRVTLSRDGKKIFEFELFPPNKIVVTEMMINLDNNLAMIQTGPSGEKWFMLIGDINNGGVVLADKQKYLIKGLQSLELKGIAKLIEKTGEKIEFIKI